VVPMVPAQLDIIQSIAIQKRAGARTQPWRTPEVVSNGSDSWQSTLTRDVVPVCRCSISCMRNGGAPDDLSAFHSAARSTESNAALISDDQRLVEYIADVARTEDVELGWHL